RLDQRHLHRLVQRARRVRVGPRRPAARVGALGGVRRFDDAGGGRRHREAGPAPAPARRARPRLKRPMSGRPGTKKPRTGGAFRSSGGTAVSVAHLLLQVLPALLRINGALGGQARLEAVETDLFAGIDAEAVITRVDTLERAVDLADQLAVAVA